MLNAKPSACAQRSRRHRANESALAKVAILESVIKMPYLSSHDAGVLAGKLPLTDL